jgi:hypothetical protein
VPSVGIKPFIYCAEGSLSTDRAIPELLVKLLRKSIKYSKMNMMYIPPHGNIQLLLCNILRINQLITFFFAWYKLDMLKVINLTGCTVKILPNNSYIHSNSYNIIEKQPYAEIKIEIIGKKANLTSIDLDDVDTDVLLLTTIEHGALSRNNNVLDYANLDADDEIHQVALNVPDMKVSADRVDLNITELYPTKYAYVELLEHDNNSTTNLVGALFIIFTLIIIVVFISAWIGYFIFVEEKELEEELALE